MTHKHKKKTHDRGLWAERWAMLYLMLKGYKILETRYKTKMGEIDLIIQKHNVIAFVEVKARVSKAQALESVTPNMRKRIERSALSYLSKNPKFANCDARFDVVAVSPFVITRPFFIHHLDNAWQQGA